MMHRAWSSIVEVPYCFSRSYVKFQGHTALKIVEFHPNWAFPDYRPVAAFKSLRFALFFIFISVSNMASRVRIQYSRWPTRSQEMSRDFENSYHSLRPGELGHHWIRQWRVACLVPSHYLNQCWNIMKYTVGRYFNGIPFKIQKFSSKNAFENVVSKMLVMFYVGLSVLRGWDGLSTKF